MAFTKDSFKGHWSEAETSMTDRRYIFIDNSTGVWKWWEYGPEKETPSGTVTFDTSNPPRALLNGNTNYPTYFSLAELSNGSTGISDEDGHTLRLASCVAIFNVIQSKDGYTKELNFKTAFPDKFAVTGERVEIPTNATALIRYNLPDSLGVTFKTGESWLHWESYTKEPQVQLIRIDDHSVVIFDKVPAVEGDNYTFVLKGTGPSGDVDIDPIVVVKAPPVPPAYS